MISDKVPSVALGLKYGSINGIALVLSKALRGLAVPKLLDPTAYGLFSSIGLFTRYLNFTDLGTVAHFTKEIPKLHFRAEPEPRQSLINQTFSLLAMGILVSSLVLLGLSVLYKGKNAEFYKIAILLLIPIFILSKIREFHMCYLYGTGHYGHNAAISVVANYATLVLVVMGVYWYDALGGVVATLISEILLMIAVLKTVRLNLKFKFDRFIFYGLHLYFKQFLVQITETLAVTIDQALLLFIFGPVSFGIYILGHTFAWLFEALSEIFNTAFYPKIMATSLSHRDAAINVMQQSIFAYLAASFIALPGAIISMDWLIASYFPKYQAGMDIYVLMLFLGLSRGALALLKKGYIATNNEKKYIVNSLISMSTNTVAALTAWAFGLSFNEIVFSLVCANLLNYSICYLRLVTCEHLHFARNAVLIVLFLAMVALYQFNRSDIYRLSSINNIFIFCIAAYASILILGWNNKSVLVRYLE